MSKLTMIFGITIALLLYGSTNLYVGYRLYGGLALLFPSLGLGLFACIYGAVALVLLFPFFPLPRGVYKWASAIGSYWMGLFIYLLLSFAVVDVFLLAGILFQLIPASIPADIRLWAWVLAILAAAGFAGYGIFHARTIKVVRYDLKWKDSTVAPPLKIAVISDLHLGAVHAEERLANIVERVNALKPDLIAIPGDLFNDDVNRIQNPERVKEMFRQLKAPFGVYASLGNHDGGRTFPRMVKLLQDSGITLLMEESVIIDGNGGRFALVGRLDPSPIGGYGGLKRKKTEDLLAQIEPGLPLIVLDHTPSFLDQYGSEVDLIVSGHTHKGQIFPGNLITRRVFEVDYGHYQKDPASPHVIVTSGAGTWGMPMRVASDNEVVEIVLS